MPNPLNKLIEPRWPNAAVGITDAGAGVVSLDRRRDTFTVRRAGYVAFPPALVRPDFNDANIADTSELADVLAELVTGVGLAKQRRWSVALPEAATRTTILTMDNAPASRGELEEMLRWKMERSFGGAPLEELRISRQNLRPDAQGRPRYLISAVRLEVLAEYEVVFAALGWHAGLILPRHMGEAWWLMRDGVRADSLLISAHREGFTAMLLRAGEPLIVRGVVCDAADCPDELYRFLLFYRDRLALPVEAGSGQPDVAIERLFVAGDGIDDSTAGRIINETLLFAPHSLRAEDVRLALPTDELDFTLLAAPAGLAALAWA